MFRRLMCDVQEAYITERPSHVAAYKLLLCCSFIVISIFCCNITHKRSIIVYSISHEPELNYETSTLGTADMPRGTKIKNVQTDPGSAFPRTSPLRNQG